MPHDTHPLLRLAPEHLDVLAVFEERRVVGARLCRNGQADPEGFALYGRLEVLVNCGLVEFLARDGRRDLSPGDVWLYYYLTDRGRDLLRWRLGAPESAPDARPSGSRAGPVPGGRASAQDVSS